MGSSSSNRSKFIEVQVNCQPMHKKPAVIFVEFHPKNAKHEIIQMIGRCFGMKLINVDELVRHSNSVLELSKKKLKVIKENKALLKQEAMEELKSDVEESEKHKYLLMARRFHNRVESLRASTSEMQVKRHVIKENLVTFSAAFVFNAIKSRLTTASGYLVDIVPILSDLEYAKYLREDLTNELKNLELQYTLNFLLSIRITNQATPIKAFAIPTVTRKISLSSNVALRSLHRYFAKRNNIVSIRINSHHLHHHWKDIELFFLNYRFTRMERLSCLIIVDFSDVDQPMPGNPFECCPLQPEIIVLKNKIAQPMNNMDEEMREYIHSAPSLADIFIVRVDGTSLQRLQDINSTQEKTRHGVYFSQISKLGDVVPKTYRCVLPNKEENKLYNVFTYTNNETFLFPSELNKESVFYFSQLYALIDK